VLLRRRGESEIEGWKKREIERGEWD